MKAGSWALPASICFAGLCVLGGGFLIAVPLAGILQRAETITTNGLKVEPVGKLWIAKSLGGF